MKYQVIQGDNREVLKQYPDNHFDSIITDPPYGIGFLGKDWDSKKATETTTKLTALHNLPSGMKMTSLADDLEFQYWLRDLWIECYRVLKPGGHILAFSAARTYHHMAMSLQTAGFEIRDQIMWIYSSGFPKSQDVGRSIQRSLGIKETKAIKNTTLKSKQLQNELSGKDINLYANGTEQTVCTDPEAQKWEGWGTALKPAHEPICLARKPSKLSTAKNVQKWGTGALNIDATRIGWEDMNDKKKAVGRASNKYIVGGGNYTPNIENQPQYEQNEQGRFPSNVIGEIPDYQKYFYCPKVSRKERHTGFDLKKVPTIEHNDPETIHLHPLWTPAIGKNVYRLKKAIEEHNAKVPPTNPNGILDNKDENGNQVLSIDSKRLPTEKGNNHPTVKPVELMKYLIKLVTPPHGKVLDPFNGSGSTGMAAVELGYEYVGIELDANYVEISLKRILAHFRDVDPLRASGLFE